MNHILDREGNRLRVGDRVRAEHGMEGPITRMVEWPNMPRGVVALHVAWKPPYQHQFHWRHAGRGRFRRRTYRCPDLLLLTDDPKEEQQ